MSWDTESCIAAIRAWYQEHGEPPRFDQWSGPSTAERPGAQLVARRFGSWRRAVEAAGFASRTPGQWEKTGRYRVPAATCEHCGGTYRRRGAGRRMGRFCSTRCFGLSKVKRDSRRHRTVRVGARQRPQHHLVAEAVLGRPLGPEEAVYHVNGEVRDNRIENLIVFPDISELMRFSALTRHGGDPPLPPEAIVLAREVSSCVPA